MIFRSSIHFLVLNNFQFMLVRIFTLIILVIIVACQKQLPPFGESLSGIRLNQLGYFPDAPKKAVLADLSKKSEFHIINVVTREVVYTGTLSKKIGWDLSGEDVQVAEFTGFEVPGQYRVYLEGLGYSYPFEISENPLSNVFKGSLKALYYQRASTALEEKHAGKWKRDIGHTDTNVPFHETAGRKGSISSSKGWYDAGDYGKYVVNGAFPLGQLLMLYEQYPDLIKDGDLTIPESGNGISDFLDELKYEMDWLLTMQDDDGGVFFKLTAPTFEGMVLPELAQKQRFIFRKSTTASLDFAAVAAKFARAYSAIDKEYAEKCLNASKAAWAWSVNNPNLPFKNPDGVITGEYGDEDFTQEFYWAAAELYVSTGNEEYLNYVIENEPDFQFSPGESWANFMHYLGAFVLIENIEESELKSSLETSIISSAEELVNRSRNNAYFQPIDDFQWGSNSDVLNTAMIIAHAYRIDPKQEYLQTVRHIVDYIFGNNAVGYSFVTGYGHQTPQFIHHRPSAGDNISDPIPGLISGGPNSRKQDASEVEYPENAPPMKCWVDSEPSYASNEICLNWNAPLTYVLGFLSQEKVSE